MSLNIVTTHDLITGWMHRFRARRGDKLIHAGGRAVRVHTSGERVLHLPNGVQVKVTTDDSGVATQIEEGEALHAVVRPHPIRNKTRNPQAHGGTL
jgi:hypothetical protein